MPQFQSGRSPGTLPSQQSVCSSHNADSEVSPMMALCIWKVPAWSSACGCCTCARLPYPRSLRGVHIGVDDVGDLHLSTFFSLILKTLRGFFSPRDFVVPHLHNSEFCFQSYQTSDIALEEWRHKGPNYWVPWDEWNEAPLHIWTVMPPNGNADCPAP